MENQFCYFEDETSRKIHSLLPLQVVYKKCKNFPRISHWNQFTAEIPADQKSADAFQKFYHSKIIDQILLEDLEDEKVINTPKDSRKLYPIRTPSDGNCLCHAVSLYLWGVPDRKHFLRQLLYITLVSDENKLLQRLYMQHVASQQHLQENFDTLNCCDQWKELVKEAEEIPKNPNSSHLNPLEAIHIFILANILLRPIIVYCSPVVRNVYNQTIQPNEIGGVYLPLLWKSSDTEKSPIILAFHMNHFVPLVYLQRDANQAKKIHLFQDGFVNLPVHFLQEPMPNNIAKNLKAYLNFDKEMESILLKNAPLPKDLDVYEAHYKSCKTLYDHMTQSSDQKNPDVWGEDYFDRHSETIHIISESLSKDPCLCLNNCGMYGSPELGNKCSKCFSLDSTSSAKPLRESAQRKQELHFSHRNMIEPNEPSPYMNSKLNSHQQPLAKGCRPKLFQPPKQMGRTMSEESPKQDKFQLKVSKGVPAPKCKPRMVPSTGSVYSSHQIPKGHSENSESTVILAAWNDPALRPFQTEAPVHQRLDQLSLGTATCISSGCHAKAFRDLEYRCPSCFIKRTRNEAFSEQSFSKVNPHGHLSENMSAFSEHGLSKGNPHGRLSENMSAFSEHGLSKVNPHGRLSENTSAFSPGQAVPARKASSSGLGPAFLGPKSLPSPSSETAIEDRQGSSLLDLLCSNDNCPNRRVSPLDPLCSSCSKLERVFYCSTPGCPNERTTDNDMCKDCLKRNSRQRQATQRNESKQHLGILNMKKTQRERNCENTICFNSGSTDVPEYCLKCYMAAEKTEHPRPTAPEMFK